jgi:hypothetical protein
MSRAVWITGARRKFHLPDADASADRQERDPLSLGVSANSLTARVHLQGAIHPESILVVAMADAHRSLPRPIKGLSHWIGIWVPSVEFSHDRHFLGLGSQADEVDRDQRLGTKGSRGAWGTGSRVHEFEKASWAALSLTF